MRDIEIKYLVEKLERITHTQIWLKGKLQDCQIDLEFNNDQIVENTLRDLVTNNKVDAYFAKIKLNKDGPHTQMI